MQFMILMSTDEGAWDALSPSEQAEIVEQHGRFSSDLEAEEKLVCSFRLADHTEAKTVRKQPGGEMIVTDGPFSETKESLGGVYVIEADTMEEALKWAERSRFMPGANEVRPIWQA